jgi:hypothetical protein
VAEFTLAMLRSQEIAHHTDPATAPLPHLSSLQLHDLILQDEHSVAASRTQGCRLARCCTMWP